MSKVLLVFEDYTELTTIEAALKKVGFDVVGLTNEYSMAEQVLGFNPDVVVGSGRGKVSALSVGRRLKDMNRWGGKSVLIFHPYHKPQPQDLLKIRVDLILESPVSPERLIQVLSQVMGIEEGALLDRLAKYTQGGAASEESSSQHIKQGAKAESESQFVTGGTSATESKAVSGKAGSADASQVGVAKSEGNKAAGVDGNGAAANKAADATESSSAFADPFAEGQEFSEEDLRRELEAHAEAAEVQFDDVDLKSFEAELLGKPTTSSSEAVTARGGGSSPAGSDGLTAKSTATAGENGAVTTTPGNTLSTKEDLLQGEAKLAQKMSKYREMTKDMKLSSKSTLSRVETKRRQRELLKDWDQEKIKDMDDLRRDFVKALFKK